MQDSFFLLAGTRKSNRIDLKIRCVPTTAKTVFFSVLATIISFFHSAHLKAIFIRNKQPVLRLQKQYGYAKQGFQTLAKLNIINNPADCK